MEAAILTDLLRDAEVALALSHLARRTGDMEAHERYARLAVELLPDWLDALTGLGCAILAIEKERATPDAERGIIAQDLVRVDEAEILFTRAIERVPANDPMGRLAGLYYNRSLARRLGGREQEANSDLTEAFRRAPGNPAIVLAYAMGAETTTEINDALSALAALTPEAAERDKLQYISALLLLSRRQSGDLDQAFSIIQELSSRLRIITPPLMRSDIVRLRTLGRYRQEHLEAEVDVLAQSFETDRALSLLQDWLAQHPADKQARLHLSLLALQHGRKDLATFDESQLPSVADLARPEDGAALVHVLRHGPAPGHALEIAYQLYRRFPDHIATHHTLVICVFNPLMPHLEIERPVAVGRNTAASIRRDGESPCWIYVEDGPETAITRREYAETHELVVELWGRKAGERFEFQGHAYEVVGVEHRILRRVHEIMERFEENFPDRPFFRRFCIPANPPPDAQPEAILGDMMTLLKRDAEHNELLQSMYRENRLPITSLATLLGRSTFDVVCHLAYDSTMDVRADNGEAERWPQAIANLRKSTEIVLDTTILAGVLILNLWDILPRLGFRFIVPRAVLDEIRELSLNAASSHAPGGTLGLYQGRPFFRENSLDELACRVDALEKVTKFINEHCEVVGGTATLDLPAEDRKEMQKVLGVAATDALALAKKRNGVLWKDDLGLHTLAGQPDLNVRSVWTGRSCCIA